MTGTDGVKIGMEARDGVTGCEVGGLKDQRLEMSCQCKHFLIHSRAHQIHDGRHGVYSCICRKTWTRMPLPLILRPALAIEGALVAMENRSSVAGGRRMR